MPPEIADGGSGWLACSWVLAHVDDRGFSDATCDDESGENLS
ncbi:hypothetical protein [[Phormidium] sp. ETS-05]|nr:hypothetical protein [[Phormidium] sp. ETS-05]